MSRATWWVPQQSPTPTAAPTASPTAEGNVLRGTMVLDGATEGCGGEQIAVQVRDATGVVGSQLVDSNNEGFDCIFTFTVKVPVLDCYNLVIDGQPVGRYPAGSLKANSGIVGIIDSASVYGSPETDFKPSLYADYDGCG